MIVIVTISQEESIFSLISNYPEIKVIMFEIGFKDILKPGILQSVGRIMNLRKGYSMKGIHIDELTETFRVHGFEII